MIAESQTFRDIETSSKRAELPDKSTIVMDIMRGGVTIENKVIPPNEDIAALIENFTGDKINSEGSRANKIYHFGGQFLQADFLREFTNTTLLMSEQSTGL